MSNLRAIKTKPEPNPEVVEFLRRLLAEAEKGEIVGLIAVYESPRGETCNERSTLTCAAAILGELKLAADDLSDALRYDEDE